MPAPDGPITAVRLDGLSLNDACWSSCFPPATTVVRPSAYSVNSCVVADASSWVPSQRKVWLPKITSAPTASCTEPSTLRPLTKVPLKLPRSWRNAGSSRAARLEQGVVPADERVLEDDGVVLATADAEIGLPAATCCGSTTE